MNNEDDEGDMPKTSDKDLYADAEAEKDIAWQKKYERKKRIIYERRWAESGFWERVAMWGNEHIFASSFLIAITIFGIGAAVVVAAASAEQNERDTCLSSGRDWSCRNDGHNTITVCNPVGSVMVCTPQTTPRTVCSCVGKDLPRSP